MKAPKPAGIITKNKVPDNYDSRNTEKMKAPKAAGTITKNKVSDNYDSGNTEKMKAPKAAGTITKNKVSDNYDSGNTEKMKAPKPAGTITKNQVPDNYDAGNVEKMKAPKAAGTITKNNFLTNTDNCDIIIGIDPGLQNLGIGIIAINKNKNVASENVIITKKRSKLVYHAHEIAKCLNGYACITLKLRVSSSIEQRLHYIFEQLCILFETYQPKLIVVENAFVGINKNAALKLGMARGCIFTAIGKHKIQAHPISPKQIKMEITGTGEANKEDINNLFQSILPNWGNNTLDSSDALAGAFCGVKLLYEGRINEVETLEQTAKAKKRATNKAQRQEEIIKSEKDTKQI